MRDGADARLIAQLGEEACRRMATSKMALIGAGTVGGAVSTHAAMLGIPHVIVDPGRVEPHSLGSQLFPEIARGDAKSEVRGWLAKLLNSESRVEPLAARIEDLGLARLADARLLVSALDSRRSRLRVSLLSQRLRRPFLDLAVGNADQGLLGTVALYDPNVEGSACFACRYGPEELGAIYREGRTSCESWRSNARPVTQDTLASSPLAAITAGFGMLWAIRELCGEGDSLAGQMLVISGFPPRLRMVRLERSARCLQGHGSYLPLREADDDALGDVLEDAAEALHGMPDALVFVGRALVLGLRCPSCGATRGIARVAQAVSDSEALCSCGSPDEMVPVRLTERVSGKEALELAELGWGELGVPQEDVVLAERGSERLAYRVHRLHPPEEVHA